ncbi:MAG: N5-glutamine methyltransferase family protein, partial [Paracoccaceae bacterium]
MTDPLPRPASLALVEATQTLRAAGIEGASADARKLMAYALDVPPSRLTLVLPDPMSDQAEARLSRAVAARATRQPVSQILGHRLFFGRDLRVTPDVLDPRPETETLVLAVMSLPFATVLDMGTGSGAILISLLAERPGTTGLG